MEIYSIRSSQSFQFRNGQKSNGKPDDTAQHARGVTPAFQVSPDAASGPDFGSISVVELREIARRSFDQGQIDHDTFSTLYEGLPMHTIDTNGRVVDLSDITDTTPFNFRDYYLNQLRVAASIGDPRTASVLQSVVSFIENPPRF